MTETKIYVGLNDSETLEQKLETAKYVSLLKKVCYCYHVPFSFSLAEGGYFNEKGDFTQEKTLILSLIDAKDETIEEIAKALCAFFHQESVMITKGQITACFVSESL